MTRKMDWRGLERIGKEAHVAEFKELIGNLPKGLEKHDKISVAVSPQTNYTDPPTGRRLWAMLVPTFAGRGMWRGQRN
jgi:hypothetical protein